MTGERPLFVVIGVSGFRELLAWVIAATRAEQREQHGEFLKEAIQMALDAVDHDDVNRQIRRALQPDPFATMTSPTANPWRN